MSSNNKNDASFNNSFNSSWSSKDWKDNEERRKKQYGLESGGRPTEFASPGAMGSPSTGRRSLKKTWNNKPTELSAQRCDEWLSPPSDELALLASPGKPKRRSYTIKKEIPAPDLD